MKKVLSFALVVSILASLFVAMPVAVNAETEGVFEYSIEIDNFMYVIKNGTYEEKIAKVEEYINIIAPMLGYTGEQIKLEETIDEILATLELQIARLGHKHYENTEDSYYVAIGGDTAKGTGIDLDKGARYYDIIGADYSSNKKIVAKRRLLPSEVVEYITANEAEIVKADLITYQMDASSIIYAALVDVPDWDRYIAPEVRNSIREAWEEVKITDLKIAGAAFAEDLAQDIKGILLQKLPAEMGITENDIDNVIEFCMPYIQETLAYVEEFKNALANKIESTDEMILEYAERFAYAFVSYMIETASAISEIREINPDATLVVVGAYNPLDGLIVKTDDASIDVSGISQAVVDVINIYYSILAVGNKDFAFVDISDAETEGFDDAIDAENLDLSDLAGMILEADDSMHANGAGHEYIAEQIIKATTCYHTNYVAVDNKCHAVMCLICGHVDSIEPHDGSPCIKCGYVTNIERVTGDADGDGEIAVKDVVLIRRFITGGYVTGILLGAADVNDDDLINVKDVVLLRRFIAGGYNVELK